MSITLQEIVEETRRWSPEKVGELVAHLTRNLHAAHPEIDTAWKAEIRRRIDEIETGKVQGIPAEEVFSEARRILGQ
jgi:putative addiction module component (TIGR02574 family)